MSTPARDNSDPVRSLFGILDGKRNEIKMLLPKSIDVDHFIGVCKTAVLQTPDLASADRRTFFTACMAAANDGLFPDGKEAVLNIYNSKIKQNGQDIWIKKVQYLPMAAGMIKKLYATGQVTFVDAAAVYEKDQFDYERGDNQRLIHKPTLDDQPGKVVAAYAVVKLANGEVKREVMPRRDIEKVKSASKASNGPGWTDWYDQFAIKSVLKRAYKQLPKMADFEKIIEADNEALGFHGFSALDSVGVESSAPALPHLSQDEFEAELRNCAAAINAGRDADEVVAMVETRHTLNDEQKARIRECGRPIDGETQPSDGAGHPDPWVANYERKEHDSENTQP